MIDWGAFLCGFCAGMLFASALIAILIKIEGLP